MSRAALVVVALVGCSPAAPPRAPATAPAVDACAADADCAMTQSGCGPCRPCPDSPVRALTSVALAAEEAACVRARASESPVGADCSRCRPDLLDAAAGLHAACVDGACVAAECARDDDCTVTQYLCSRCGVCPGSPYYAIGKSRLAALVAACGVDRGPPVACSPCEQPPPGPHFPTTAVCDHGRCLGK